MIIMNVFEQLSVMQKYCTHTTNQLNSLQLHIIYIGIQLFIVWIKSNECSKLCIGRYNDTLKIFTR